MNHVYEFTIQKGLVSGIISILIVTILVHFAAKIVIHKGGFIPALIVAVLGSLLAGIVWGLIDGIWGQVAAVATWALVAAVVFRTAWIKGALIGITAWILWFLIGLVVRLFV